jgi:hypothetical protein
MVCRLYALGHKLGLLRMTVRVVSLAAGSGISLSRSPSNAIEVDLTLATPFDLSSKQNELELAYTGESLSKLKLPGCCPFCSRMTLEHQILIKRGIKRASFHHVCHRTDLRKSFPNASDPLFTMV